MKLLTKERQKSDENAKLLYICKEKLDNKRDSGKRYRKVRDHCHYRGEHRSAAHSIGNLKYRVPRKIPIDNHSNQR